MSSQPVVRAHDANHVVATWERVLIQIWRGEATSHAVEGMAVLTRAWVQELGQQPCGCLSVIESSSPAPNERVRPLLTAYYREFAPRMAHQLFVAEGSGFRAALVRGVGLGVSALAPSLLPFKFASSVAEAALILAPTLSPASGGAAGLEGAVARARASLG